MTREAIESPETSPATTKTLSSPSLAAMSKGALALETDENHCTLALLNLHFLLNKALAMVAPNIIMRGTIVNHEARTRFVLCRVKEAEAKLD